MPTPIDYGTVEALTFDCYGTLIDWEAGLTAAFRPILEAHQTSTDDEDVLVRLFACMPMTPDTLKLYHSPASPNSRRVRIFLAEKGLNVPLVAVDLAKGEQHSEAYRAINPRRVVPTLVLEDGTAIGEVPAIMRYLDEAFPETPLAWLDDGPAGRRHLGALYSVYATYGLARGLRQPI